MAAGILLLPFLAAITFAIYARTRNPLHPFFVLLGIFGTLAVGNFAFADAVQLYPLRASGLGAIVLALTSVGLGVLAATLVAPPPGPNAAPRLATTHDADGIMYLAVVLFVLSSLSTAWYWYDVFSTLGLYEVATNPARLKAAELTGIIDPNSRKYLFRGALFVPVALTLAVFMKPDRRLPKLMLFVYLVTVLIGVRRGPILQAFSAVLATAVVAADSPKRLVAPIAIGASVFVAISVSLLFVLQRFNLQVGPTLFGYTAGNLSSFQAVLDDYYPPDVHLPLEHTLWFFYSAMKYVSPTLAPASIRKPNPFQDLPNTYTFLTDYYLDLGPWGMVIPPLCVGILMGLAYCLVVRKPGLVALTLFAAVYAVTTDSFLNNSWGWLTIPMSVVFAAIVSVVLLAPCNAMARFRRAELARTGASSGSGVDPPVLSTV